MRAAAEVQRIWDVTGKGCGIQLHSDSVMHIISAGPMRVLVKCRLTVTQGT